MLRSPFNRHELFAGHDGGRFLITTFSRAIAEEGVAFSVPPAPLWPSPPSHP